MIAVVKYIQQKCKQKPITHEHSSVIWQKITHRSHQSECSSEHAPSTDSLTVVIRNKGESHVFLRKISLKIACKLAIKIETVSCPCNTCFWYARTLVVRNMSLGCASWRISYSQRSSVSKTRIAGARDCFYICRCCDRLQYGVCPLFNTDCHGSSNFAMLFFAVILFVLRVLPFVVNRICRCTLMKWRETVRQ